MFFFIIMAFLIAESEVLNQQDADTSTFGISSSLFELNAHITF